jgi:hypothetical protein
MDALVHGAGIQDRAGGAFLMTSSFGLYPFLLKLSADGGYQGPDFRRALKKILARVRIEIVKRSDQASADAAGSSRTSKTSIAKRSPSCVSLPSGSCYESFVILHDVSGQTLKADPRTINHDQWLGPVNRLHIASGARCWFGRAGVVGVCLADWPALRQRSAKCILSKNRAGHGKSRRHD